MNSGFPGLGAHRFRPAEVWAHPGRGAFGDLNQPATYGGIQTVAAGPVGPGPAATPELRVLP